MSRHSQHHSGPRLFRHLTAIACAAVMGSPVAQEVFPIRSTAADAALAERLQSPLQQARAGVEHFFGGKFPSAAPLEIFPDRQSLTAHWRQAWKAPDLQAECWMVASGTAAGLDMLSPRVWRTEACEHDPDDQAEMQQLLAHELVHVYHGQLSPDPDFDGLEEIAWFVEGVATYASGQLSVQRDASVRSALAAQAPPPLARLWSGPQRYGYAGSLVRYIDQRYGRTVLRQLLRLSTQTQILAVLGVSEQELLAAWRQSMLAGMQR